MKLGSLCSGAGGLDLAVEQVFGAETAWHCEIDDAAAKVLAHRWTGVPNHRDLTATDWGAVEPIDILTGGYPCQPFSHAGKRKGTDDERHIWPDVREAIRRLRPRYTFLENRRPLVPPRRWARCSPSSGTARRAALRTLRAGVRDRHHPRAVWGVPESAGGGG